MLMVGFLDDLLKTLHYFPSLLYDLYCVVWFDQGFLSYGLWIQTATFLLWHEKTFESYVVYIFAFM
jgi:hypothetical protein